MQSSTWRDLSGSPDSSNYNNHDTHTTEQNLKMYFSQYASTRTLAYLTIMCGYLWTIDVVHLWMIDVVLFVLTWSCFSSNTCATTWIDTRLFCSAVYQPHKREIRWTIKWLLCSYLVVFDIMVIDIKVFFVVFTC